MSIDDTLREARIVAVDDEPTNLRLIQAALARDGYTNLTTTTDPAEALALCEQHAPDLLILDLMMPDIDGLEVLHRLATLASYDRALPVLVLTADPATETRHRALAAGATDFLTKPVDPIDLRLRVRNLLRTRVLHRELARQNARLEDEVRERTSQLLEAEKLATMGNLLAGVAHELNNPLAVITGHIHLMHGDSSVDAMRARANKIAAAAERSVRIVKNFLAMARRRSPERHAVAIDRIAREVAELFVYEFRTADVALRLELGEVPAFHADGHQLHQVLVNLVGNAQHALRSVPGARVLTIRTAWDSDRQMIVISVADNGPGVSEGAAAKVFDPFFTTKPIGEGTGLGLSLCRDIVTAHGGTIRLERGKGPGATFVIELPYRPPPARSGEAGADSPPQIGRRRILVVDDETDVVSFVADALRREGHEVEIASDGADALERCRHAVYDLILSDSGMPKLSGTALYAALARERRHPRNRFIFLSGDVLNPAVTAFLEKAGVPTLAKPFSVDALVRLVRETLSKEPAAA